MVTSNEHSLSFPLNLSNYKYNDSFEIELDGDIFKATVSFLSKVENKMEVTLKEDED